MVINAGRKQGRRMPPIISSRTISDLGSLEAVLDEAIGSFHGSLPYWRGHADADWPLIPHVFRKGISEIRGAFTYNEQGLLYYFRLRGPSRLTPHPPQDDLFGWLLLAQHYGLPTRLLDWSLSVLAALYFALEDPAKDDVDGCIWALNGAALNHHQLGRRVLVDETWPHVSETASRAFSGEASSVTATYAMNARETDLRMLVQQSAFTIHSDRGDLRDVAVSEPYLMQYRILKSAKAHMRQLIRRLGITHSSLFPDLAGLANELRGTNIGPQ